MQKIKARESVVTEGEVVKPQITSKQFVEFLRDTRGSNYRCPHCGNESWEIHNEAGMTGSGAELEEESLVLVYMLPMSGNRYFIPVAILTCVKCSVVVQTSLQGVERWLSSKKESEGISHG